MDGGRIKVPHAPPPPPPPVNSRRTTRQAVRHGTGLGQSIRKRLDNTLMLKGRRSCEHIQFHHVSYLIHLSHFGRTASTSCAAAAGCIIYTLSCWPPLLSTDHDDHKLNYLLSWPALSKICCLLIILPSSPAVAVEARRMSPNNSRGGRRHRLNYEEV